MSESTIRRMQRLQRTYNRGENLFVQGEDSHDLYVFLNGEVTVYKDDQKISIVNKPGTFIGEISALLKQPRSATCVSTRTSTLILVPEDSFESFVKMAPSLALKLSVMMAERLDAMNKKYLQLLEERGGGSA